jgi:hypothetical protein
MVIPPEDIDYSLIAMANGYRSKLAVPAEWQVTDTSEVLYGQVADHKVQLSLLRIAVNDRPGRIVRIRTWDGTAYSIPPPLRIDQRALISGSCFNALRYMIDQFDWQFYVMITGEHQYGLQCSINYDINDQMKWTRIQRHEPIYHGSCTYDLYTRRDLQLSIANKQTIVERVSNES